MSYPSAVGPPAVRRVSGLKIIAVAIAILMIGLTIGLVLQAQPTTAKIVSQAETAASLTQARSGERAATTPLWDRQALANSRMIDASRPPGGTLTAAQKGALVSEALIEFRAGERKLTSHVRPQPGR